MLIINYTNYSSGFFRSSIRSQSLNITGRTLEYLSQQIIKEEVFINDKGEDLKERLGRVKAINMKGDEVEKTKYILNLRDRLYALMNDEVI